MGTLAPPDTVAAVVADDAAGEAHQDRREDRAPRTLRHLPDDRGRDPERPVGRHPAPHRSAQAESTPNVTKGSSPTRAGNRTAASATTARLEISDPVTPFFRSIRWHRRDGGWQTLPPLPSQRAGAAINPLEGFHRGNHG